MVDSPRHVDLGYTRPITRHLASLTHDLPSHAIACRYNSAVANEIERRGLSPRMMLLTHMDDVGEMGRWKERFPALERVMHAADVRGPDDWPYIDMRTVETQLEGDGPWELEGGLTAVHTPGHSRGSVSFLFDGSWTGGEGALFTGDHLAFNGKLNRLDGFGRYGWNLPLQAESIRKLGALPFQWVLPGHGRRWHFGSDAEREEQIESAAAEFEADPLGNGLGRGQVFNNDHKA